MSRGLVKAAVRPAYYATLNALPLSVRRRFWYAAYHRRPLHLKDPQAFSEKVNWRIVNDRRPVLADTCDKLRMKEYATAAGQGLVRVPHTYWAGTDVGELAGVDLPERWVLKPTHRSAQVIFGEGVPDVDRLRAQTAGWTDEWNWSMFGEWAYGQATAQLFVEEVIGEPGNPPEDYKIFVFDGKPHVIQVDSGRFTGHVRRFYTPAWEPLPHRNIYPLGPEIARPQGLEQMLAAAAALGAPFDFIRIDLYDIDGTVWFGETSPYPGGGLEPFDPRDLDVELGRRWQLPDVAEAQRGQSSAATTSAAKRAP